MPLIPRRHWGQSTRRRVKLKEKPQPRAPGANSVWGRMTLARRSLQPEGGDQLLSSAPLLPPAQSRSGGTVSVSLPIGRADWTSWGSRPEVGTGNRPLWRVKALMVATANEAPPREMLLRTHPASRCRGPSCPDAGSSLG